MYFLGCANYMQLEKAIIIQSLSELLSSTQGNVCWYKPFMKLLSIVSTDCGWPVVYIDKQAW